MENSDKKPNDFFTHLFDNNLPKDHYEQLMNNDKVIQNIFTENFDISQNDSELNLDDITPIYKKMGHLNNFF